jgi:hypothetical protein
MPFSRWVLYYLMIAPHALLLGILVAIVRRGTYKRFPVFLAYIATEIIQFIVLFTMYASPSVTASQYAWGYALGLALSTAIRFGIIQELFAYLFRNYAASKYFGKPLFRWMTVGLLLGALGLTFYAGGDNFDRLLFTVHALDRAASILQCGLLLGLFLFSAYLGLSWRNHAFGIALGLGVFASIQLVAAAIRAQTGFAYSRSLDYLTMGTYHVCVLVWLFYLWAPEPSVQYAVRSVPDHDLELWNKELQRLIKH